jgi:hypothetical protein
MPILQIIKRMRINHPKWRKMQPLSLPEKGIYRALSTEALLLGEPEGLHQVLVFAKKKPSGGMA